MSTETPEDLLAEAIAGMLPGEFNAQSFGRVVDMNVAGNVFHFIVGTGRGDVYAHVRVDDRLDEFVRDRDHDERCTVHVESGGDLCSRKSGHPGQHITQGVRTRRILAVGPNNDEPAAPIAGGDGPGDPLAHVAQGDRLTPDQWVSSDSRGPSCGNVNKDASTPGYGLRCCREPDHPGQHIGTYPDGYVCGVWPNEPAAPPKRMTMADWEAVEPGQRPDPTEGISEAVQCKFDIAGDACTREHGHIGKHVSGNGLFVKDVRDSVLA